jgi:hypothetical protein
MLVIGIGVGGGMVTGGVGAIMLGSIPPGEYDGAPQSHAPDITPEVAEFGRLNRFPP